MEAALRAGYRHVDCAHIYGNEAEIGQALKKCFGEGVCKREELFITSKLWSVESPLLYTRPSLSITSTVLSLSLLTY